MSTALRLYRELSNTEPSKRVRDSTLARERCEVLSDLGQRGKNIVPRTEANKHHGKLARINSNRSSEIIEEVRKKKEIQAVMQQADAINAVVKKFSNQLEAGAKLPDKFFLALEQHYSAPLSPSYSRSKSGSSELIKGSQPCPAAIRPSTKDTTLNALTPMSKVRPTSSFDWSSEELKHFNDIYLSIPKPKSKTKEDFNFYCDAFCKRHRLIYHRRTKKEVIEKVRALLISNRGHELGEHDYWVKFERPH